MSIHPLLEGTRQKLVEFLAQPDAQAVRDMLVGLSADSVALTRKFSVDRVFPVALQPAFALAEQLQPGRFLMERYLLAEASLSSIEKLPGYAVADKVKELLCKEYSFFAAPHDDWIHTFRPESRNYRSYVRMALLIQFPAGQLQWEISGIPRRWMAQIPARDLPRVLFFIGARLGAFSPCFYIHIPPRRTFMLESASLESYHRMAESMLLQPEIRGIITSSWLHSEQTLKISPHLRWLNRVILENGGLVTHIGYAPPDAGFLEGSPERVKMYESGGYKPREALVIWPRKNVLEWANRYRSEASKKPR